MTRIDEIIGDDIYEKNNYANNTRYGCRGL